MARSCTDTDGFTALTMQFNVLKFEILQIENKGMKKKQKNPKTVKTGMKRTRKMGDNKFKNIQSNLKHDGIKQ